MTKKKNNIILISVISILSLFAITFLFYYARKTDAGIQGLGYCNNDSVANVFSTSTARGIPLHSGETVLKLDNSTTTRPLCDIARTRDIALNILAVSSTSAAVIGFQIEFSDDGGTWFPYHDYISTNSAAVTLTNATGTVFYWTPGQIATSSLRIHFPTIGARYIRSSFKGILATSTVWYYFTKPEEMN